jgi:hypothetical protein
MNKSAKNQKALRDRRRDAGLKCLTRYVRPEWIADIDILINQLKKAKK